MTGPVETWVGSLYGTVLTSRMGVRSSEALAPRRCLALRGGGSWGCHQPSDGSIWRRVYPRGTRPGLSTRWAGSPGEGLTATSASPSSDPPQLGHGQHVGRECLEPWEQHERGEASLTQNHRAPSQSVPLTCSQGTLVPGVLIFGTPLPGVLLPGDPGGALGSRLPSVAHPVPALGVSSSTGHPQLGRPPVRACGWGG